MSGRKIIEGLKQAVAGDLSRVSIDGQTWVRLDATALREAEKGGKRAILDRLKEPSDELLEIAARAICESMGRDPVAPFKDHHGRAMDFPEWHRWEAEGGAVCRALAATLEGE